MATLNATVQEMIDNLHTKMKEGTLKAEEQMLIGKGLEALMSNASWEKALIAVAEDNISESKALLTTARDELNTSNTALTDSITKIKQQYSQLITVGSYSQFVSMGAGKTLVVTPPSGSRVRVFQLIAFASNQSSLATLYSVTTTIGDRKLGSYIGGSTTASPITLKLGLNADLNSSLTVASSLNSNQELLGKVDEPLTFENTNMSSAAYFMLGCDFVTGDN